MEQRSAERVQRDQPDVREAWEMALRRKKWVRWIVSWLPHRLTIAVRTLLRWQHLVVAKVRHHWRRSLQLRVVGTTLVISATVIAVLGFFLTEQIADGLLLNAETSARAQALTGLSIAQSQPGLTAPPSQRAGRDAGHGVDRPACSSRRAARQATAWPSG